MRLTEFLAKCFEPDCDFQAMVKLEDESLKDIDCFSCGKLGSMKAIK